MIPLHDDNPTTIRPLVTIGIIAVCVLVFLWQASLPAGADQRAVYAFGLVPAVLFGERALPPDVAIVSAELSVLTSMFLHGGWLHLIGNMLYLWIFGNNIEDAMGHVRFVFFYVLCGIAAALVQSLQDPGSTIPMIGASGAIGGVLGGYLVLYPHARVLVLLPLGFFSMLVRIPALWVLGVWFALQFFQSIATAGQIGGVAFWAHVGGFVAGVILIVPFRHKSFPLFGRSRHGRQPVFSRRPGTTSPWTRSTKPPRRRGPWA